MADENASPISAAKPPVANPMASATSVHASTLKLKPVIRKPGTATATALKPGVKLPTQTALKPGVRLPTKPAIRKPGEAAAPATPAAPAAAAPAAPAEPQPVAPSAVEALKGATQKLKGITQQIPAQAILHKTGIIADQELTEAQKQASKSRTARISLSDAIGVAPVKSEAAPMKTIRIKRPVDLQNQAAKPAAEAPAAPAAEVAPVAAPAEEEAKTPETATITQRKTLKIARPGAAGTRPTGKFGIKKPGSTTAAAAPTAEAGAEGEVSDLPPVGDIPDMPPANTVAMYTNTPASSIPPDRIRDVGTVCNVFSLLFQIAACGVIAFLGYSLIMFSQRPLRCGGTRPDGAQLSTQMFSQIRADRMPQEAVEPEFVE